MYLFNYKQLGTIRKIDYNIVTDSYIYKFIGGSEPRYGNMFIEGSFEQGYINFRDMNNFVRPISSLLYNRADNILRTKDLLTYILLNSTIRIIIDEVEIIELSGLHIKELSFSLKEGDYAIVNASFYASSIYQRYLSSSSSSLKSSNEEASSLMYGFNTSYSLKR